MKPEPPNSVEPVARGIGVLRPMLPIDDSGAQGAAVTSTAKKAVKARSQKDGILTPEKEWTNARF